ncbi:hypothetical protein PF003_g35435 [Phytophthora fragariae]|nr:hypothetical protein PF003_g35435 [Phytophthora fragariae]
MRAVIAALAATTAFLGNSAQVSARHTDLASEAPPTNLLRLQNGF